MATLEKWAPLPDLDFAERRLRRFFEDVGVAPSMSPAADIYDTGNELVVEVDVPGFDEKELAVALTDHTLTISGTRASEETAKAKTLRLRERLEAHFERRFHLPPEADLEHVTAEYGKGVLTLHVPKIADAKPRSVQIVKK